MLIVLDTETTGLDKPNVVEIAFGIIPDTDHMNDIDMVEGRFKPAQPISIKAMSVHGITNEMVDDSPDFRGSDIYNMLKEYNTPDNVFVIHNAKFDIGVLENEGIKIISPVIDTYKCAKVILMDYPDVEYNLQYLKYYLKLYAEDQPSQIEKYAGQAHGAAADVVTLFLLLRRMAAKYPIDKMIEMSSKPILYDKMPFGKHKGRNIKDIVTTDKGYTNWIFDKADDEDVKYSFKYWKKVLSNN